jgi:hypothetical protein
LANITYTDGIEVVIIFDIFVQSDATVPRCWAMFFGQALLFKRLMRTASCTLPKWMTGGQPISY